MTIYSQSINPPVALCEMILTVSFKDERNSFPSAVPHQSIREDTFMGKTIPAKSMIIPNIW